MNKEIYEEVIKSYKELLPKVNPDDLNEALVACYLDGMTATELKKKTYAYLYPSKKASLYE